MNPITQLIISILFLIFCWQYALYFQTKDLIDELDNLKPLPAKSSKKLKIKVSGGKDSNE